MATPIKYPLAKETINTEDIDALCEWLKTYPRLTKGELTPQLEKEWSSYIGTKYSVFNNSGSSANLLMIYAALFGGKIPNKKIVVPAVGWVTTIAPAMQFGLQPIMVGTDEKTYGMDLDQLEKVCETEKPDAVIFVQALGIPHHKERLLSLKKKYGFYLLEDACAALGAEYNDGTKVGCVGDMSSFSFYFGHQLSTIEGGMVNTSDKEILDILLMLRSHGWGKDLDADTYDSLVDSHGVDDFHKPFTFFIPGFNLRATDLQAFIGLRAIDKLDKYVVKRNVNFENYLSLIKNNKLQLLNDDSNFISSFAIPIVHKERDSIVKDLINNNIEVRPLIAGNMASKPMWVKKYPKPILPKAELLEEQGFYIPNHQDLTLQEIKQITDIINSYE